MSQRKRARGFALMDAAFAADPKFLRLQRKAADPATYAAAVGVYWLLVADARRSQSPEVNWADFDEYDPQVALLKEVRLLTDTGFESETFERWAPAYRSPWDRTRGTQGDAEVREGTQEYATSTPIKSNHLTSTNGVGGVGEGESFFRSPKRGSHDGQHHHCMVCEPIHPSDCAVCAPLQGQAMRAPEANQAPSE